MAHSVDGARLGRLLALVVGSTFALTASFVGIVALARGEAGGIDERLPIYVGAAAVVFVGGIVGFDGRDREKRSLGAASAVALGVSFAVGLGGEGVVYAWTHPAAVFEPQLLGYLLSASLMGTGVGVWAVRNVDALRAGGLGDAL